MTDLLLSQFLQERFELLYAAILFVSLWSIILRLLDQSASSSAVDKKGSNQSGKKSDVFRLLMFGAAIVAALTGIALKRFYALLYCTYFLNVEMIITK